MAYVEIKAKTVDLAVEAAMQELGVDDRDQLSVEVLSEPVKGFLGFGGEDAVVRVTRRKSRRKRGKTSSKKHGRRQGGQNRQRSSAKSAKNGPGQQSARGESKRESKDGQTGRHERKEQKLSDDRPHLDIEEQARITQEFLEGLVAAYGLEGDVTTEVEEDVIIADVSGEQTEALVGVRGSVRASIHELTRTVLQRYGQETARLRLDIAGYGERRRQALAIYGEQLIEQLTEEGGEIMLEPMSPADRKVIHDVASAHPGVTSYSEGEPPRRYVVLSKVEVDEEE